MSRSCIIHIWALVEKGNSDAVAASKELFRFSDPGLQREPAFQDIADTIKNTNVPEKKGERVTMNAKEPAISQREP